MYDPTCCDVFTSHFFPAGSGRRERAAVSETGPAARVSIVFYVSYEYLYHVYRTVAT